MLRAVVAIFKQHLFSSTFIVLVQNKKKKNTNFQFLVLLLNIPEKLYIYVKKLRVIFNNVTGITSPRLFLVSYSLEISKVHIIHRI